MSSPIIGFCSQILEKKKRTSSQKSPYWRISNPKKKKFNYHPGYRIPDISSSNLSFHPFNCSKTKMWTTLWLYFYRRLRSNTAFTNSRNEKPKKKSDDGLGWISLLDFDLVVIIPISRFPSSNPLIQARKLGSPCPEAWSKEPERRGYIQTIIWIVVQKWEWDQRGLEYYCWEKGGIANRRDKEVPWLRLRWRRSGGVGIVFCFLDFDEWGERIF